MADWGCSVVDGSLRRMREDIVRTSSSTYPAFKRASKRERTNRIPKDQVACVGANLVPDATLLVDEPVEHLGGVVVGLKPNPQRKVFSRSGSNREGKGRKKLNTNVDVSPTLSLLMIELLEDFVEELRERRK